MKVAGPAGGSPGIHAPPLQDTKIGVKKIAFT